MFAEGYSRGWHATCTDAKGKSHALGASVPIDGFANGWHVSILRLRPDRVFA